MPDQVSNNQNLVRSAFPMNLLRLLWLTLAVCAFSFAVSAQPDYAPATWTPPACVKWYTTGNGHHFCVIHDMEGFYEASISYLNRCDTNTSGSYNVSASVYYLVNGLQNGSDNVGHSENDPTDPPAGDITQSVRESEYAWHVVCWNRYMFGTEHEGFVSTPAWYSEAMYQASAALQRHLCTLYGIPMDRNHIIGHNEWQNPAWTNWMAANWPQIDTTCNNHTDPGQYWNWSHFMSLITNGLPPAIVTQPKSLSVVEGSNVTFTVSATGTNPLAFQWSYDQAPISGATSSSYSIAGVRLTNAGTYSVVVTNSDGGTTSMPAYLSVTGPVTNSPGGILAPSGMADWWPADGNLNDLFGHNTATPQGAFSYVAGEQGLAFNFDGATTILNFGVTNIPAPWTASLWVNRQNAPGASAALLSDGTYSIKLEQYNGTRQVGITHYGVGDYNFGYTVQAGTWVHLALVGTGSQTLLYANGTLQGTIAQNVPLPRSYIGVGYLASSSLFTDYMLGAVDELALFTRALSTAEIAAIHAAGSAGFYRAPELSGAMMSGGQFRFNLRGLTGKTFTILSSSNLTAWSAAGILQNPNGATQFVDFSASGQLWKFYRATQP